MITIDFPISFLAGVGFALAANPDTSSLGGPGAKTCAPRCTLSPGLFYQALFLTPVIVYYMTRFADWEWHYLFDARRFFLTEVSATSSIVFCITIALTVLFHQMGFAIALRWVNQGNRSKAVGLGIAAILVTIIVPLFFLHQATHVGLFAEYIAGTASPAWQHQEYIITLAVSGLIVIPTYYLAVRRQRAHPE